VAEKGWGSPGGFGVIIERALLGKKRDGNDKTPD